LQVTRNASSEGLGCVTDEENGRAINAKILMELFRCRDQFTFSSKSRFASSSKNCRILRAPVRVIAAATKSRTGTSLAAAAAAMKLLELGVNAAQLHMSPAGDRPLGLDDGKPSAKLKFEPGKQYSSHPSSPPKKSLDKNLVITGIFLQGLAATGCSRISRGRSSTAAVSGDEDDDDNELAAAALLELSKTTGR
jgi:hypothetical protein